MATERNPLETKKALERNRKRLAKKKRSNKNYSDTSKHYVEYQFADKDVVPLTRKEQDYQEDYFAYLQDKLHSKTINGDEHDDLFTIIHNCTLSQLKKRKKGLIAKGLKFRNYTAQQLEDMALDGTCRLLKSMEKRGRYVRYIIKTSDYLALYELHNARKIFNDLVDYSSVGFDDYLNKIESVEEIEINDYGEVRTKITINERSNENEFNAKKV